MKVILSAAAFGMCAVSMVPATASAAQSVAGRWITQNGKAVVQIGSCGQAVCGQIVKVVKAAPGAPKNDAYNPDERLRSRPIEGLTILSEFADSGSIWKGKIYDPESGKTYTSKLSRNPNGSLKVQGCIAFFCKTQTWAPAR